MTVVQNQEQNHKHTIPLRGSVLRKGENR